MKPRSSDFLIAVCAGMLCGPWSMVHAEWRAGAAKVDITPEYPVRLSGFGNRTTEHEGVVRRLHARALALAWDGEKPAVLLTVDNCGVPADVRRDVVAALGDVGVADERLALCFSHTHCAPMVNGVLTNLFGTDLPADQQERVARYTCDLRAHLIAVARQAIAGMKPAKVQHGQGAVRFANNRRLKTEKGYQNAPNPYGPKDHSLPVLLVTTPEGEKIATLTSYACHCTTVSPNKIHSDWAGCASDDMELRFPGVVALTAIGCGADQNPYPRMQDDLPQLHGMTVAREVVRLINEPLRDISGPLTGGTKPISLPFAPPPAREEWERLRDSGATPAVRRHAKLHLEMLGRGGIMKELPYVVQAWRFSEDLAMVFLSGEVVVDYSLRLKREFDAKRIWVNGYSNDAPCYIASDRVIKEGGYEPETSMWYYMKPGKFALGVEGRIIEAVHELVPDVFKAAPERK